MSLEKSFKIVGIGEILWDLYPSGKRLGGAPANFAYHISALGHNGIVVSRVGDDYLGKEIINFLLRNNLESGYIQVDKIRPTGTVEVKIDKDNQPNYFIKENVAWDFLGWRKNFFELSKKADAICFGTISQRNKATRKTILNFLKAANNNTVKVFDINLRQNFYNKQVFEESLTLATILKLNDFELKIIRDLLNINAGYSEEESCNFLINKYKLNLVCLTKGEEGSILVNEHSVCRSPAYPYEAINRVGAGDAFTAAVIVNYLKKYSLKIISERANRLASWVTSKEEAMPIYDTDIIGTIDS